MRWKRSVDPGVVLVTLYLALVLLFLLLGGAGAAGAAVDPGAVRPETVRRGALLVAGDGPESFSPVPMLEMDVDITVTGIVARTRVRQRFRNDSSIWFEALYVFPLPEESSVDHMRLRVGDRIITGRIREKEAARRIYEAARQDGKRASLLARQRPNIFSVAVANVGPGETVTVEIEYQQVVARQGKSFSLRFPMVVGPRYMPAGPETGGPGPSDAASPAVGVTGLIQPPVVAPGGAVVNPVRLHVSLAPGFGVGRVESLYHGITTERKNGLIDIRFNGRVAADRDFVLEWEPEQGRVPGASLFAEHRGGETFLLLMLTPPATPLREPLARETIFVLDNSGSMAGSSIRQARAALRYGVAMMRPRDRFNIITFESVTRSLFASSRPGTRKNLLAADRFIDTIRARGGTEIRPALALALDGRSDHARLRQVVLLTDACVGNDDELLSLVASRLGDTRLFTVSIGSAPNTSFMARAATMGRGAHTFIGKPDEVRERMSGLFAMLGQPAVTHLRLSGDAMAETLPAPLPDLYHGQVLTALVRMRGEAGRLRLSGLLPDRTPWQVDLDSSRFGDRPGIAVLWARKKMNSLMEGLVSGADPDQVRRAVVRLALANHLVSRYTSLVAVEEQPARPVDRTLRTHRQQVNLPAGWQYGMVFAGSAATATAWPLLLSTGFLLLAAAALAAFLRRRPE